MPISTKCPMCRSREIEEIKEPKERTFKFGDDREIIIYPTARCKRCGAEFDIKRK